MFDEQTEGRWDAHGRRSMTALSGEAAPGGAESCPLPRIGALPRGALTTWLEHATKNGARSTF